jgi:hypothetical protein
MLSFVLLIVSFVHCMQGNSTLRERYRPYHSWTAEEDARLLDLYNQHSERLNVWNEISVILNQKPELVRLRYETKLDPNLKNMQSEWTEEQNRMIINEIKDAEIEINE